MIHGDEWKKTGEEFAQQWNTNQDIKKTYEILNMLS